MQSDRQELLKQLMILGEMFPHWRFGQLILGVCKTATSNPNDPDFYRVEDADLLKACLSLIEFNKARLADADNS